MQNESRGCEVRDTWPDPKEVPRGRTRDRRIHENGIRDGRLGDGGIQQESEQPRQRAPRPRQQEYDRDGRKRGERVQEDVEPPAPSEDDQRLAHTLPAVSDDGASSGNRRAP
jgi:hypothetical protein